MNLFFRLMIVLMRARFDGRKVAFDGTSRLTYRVWITDQDAFMHMNNSRYLSLTDLAVIDFLIRTGVYGGMRKRGWAPVVVHKALNIHRMMKFPQKFDVTTRMIGWTGSYICMHHEFVSDGVVTADMLSIGRVAARKRPHPTAQDIIDTLDLDIHESPPLPAHAVETIKRLEAVREDSRSKRQNA